MKEKVPIIEIFELSNKRIAIKNKNELSIYSLNNFKLITKIKNIYESDKYIELKNKDIVRKNDLYINFFKLSGKKYKLFQTIQENGLKSIYKLNNGNFFSCSYNGINIYTKKENQYKLILNYKRDAIDAIEVEKNKIVVFSSIDDKYYIYLYDIISKEEKILIEAYYNNDDNYGKNYLNMHKNNKYLFVNFKTYSIEYYCTNLSGEYKSRTYYSTIAGYIFYIDQEECLKCYNAFPDDSKKK